jgi:hypothetical protein
LFHHGDAASLVSRTLFINFSINGHIAAVHDGRHVPRPSSGLTQDTRSGRLAGPTAASPLSRRLRGRGKYRLDRFGRLGYPRLPRLLSSPGRTRDDTTYDLAIFIEMNTSVLLTRHPPRAAAMAERLTLVAALRGISSTNSTVLGTL